MGSVIVRSAASFRCEVEAGRHHFVVDEPTSAGGSDEGPTPYDLLSAALGSCTSMTLNFYARREGIALTGVEVTITNDRSHAKDCSDCLADSGYIHRFSVRLRFHGDLTADERAKLLEIARRCPVYKTLTSEIRIDEVLDDDPSEAPPP
jgi:putative redox protein